MLQSNKLRLLHESLRRYLRAQAWERIDRLVDKTRDEVLAMVLETLSDEQQAVMFERLPSVERQANVIVEMRPPFGTRMLDPMPARQAAAILREMATDDATDIISDLGPEQAEAVLAVLDSSEEVETLMQFDEDTAGGIMLPDFLALRAAESVEEALAKLRESADVEMVYYIYVVDEAGHLVGVVSLRRLVTAAPTKTVRDVMESDVIRVTTDTDQEEVAKLVARYSFMAVPVVDDTNKLVGIVTVDDVLDVLAEEATEDILKMAGAGTEMQDAGLLRTLRVRFPWLIASTVGGIVTASVMSAFTDILSTHSYLALFLPIILGMSGNVGTQSATVTVRGIALSHIGQAVGGTWETIRREVGVGFLMGVLYGVIVGVVAGVFESNFHYGLAVGLSLNVGMVSAGVIGSVVPILLDRLQIDPAVATGPFVTPSLDALGTFTYFTIASLFLTWLLPG